jgi:outer membrane protein assembly factor BamB
MRLKRGSAMLAAIGTAAWAICASASRADDWPTYQHDHGRSAATSDRLPERLVEQWVYRSRTKPQTAWDEPAIWDGWSKIYNLKNRQVFDKVFHVAAAAGHVFFGSSVDDKIYCLDAQTGATRWAFYTEGPVRLAPTVMRGRVYTGSDDGYVYCLDAETGRMVWKYRPGPSRRRVPGNGRIISTWPIRTGVVVFGDMAYCGAGAIPSEGVYLCALNANNGTEQWKTVFHDLSAQGYMLASESRLYVTTGRDRPIVFDRATGRRLYQAEAGTGGTYALLTGDALLYGPNKTGEIELVGGKPQDHLASFAGNHMIAAGPMFYLHTDIDLVALDRGRFVRLFAERRKVAERRDELTKRLAKASQNETKPLRDELAKLSRKFDELTAALGRCTQWKVPCDYPYSLALSSDRLLAGGNGKVAGFDTATGKELWKLDVPGKAYGLAVADEQLYVSTDEGTIHCFGNDK